MIQVFFATTGGNGDTSLISPFWLDYTINDSTEIEPEGNTEITSLVNNKKATINIKMAVELNDSTPPNIVINHFYWNSNLDNNIYINPANDKLEGHVELKDYLCSDFTDVNYGTDDNKISSKVVFSGYVYDNKRLSNLN